MTDISDIQKELEAIPFANGEASLVACHHAVETILSLNNPRKATPLILRWFEENSGKDLGCPGPFVHFLEEKIDYVDDLKESWLRKPNCMSVWLVNRLANGETSREAIQSWISVLRPVVEHPMSDKQTVQVAIEFIERQQNRLEA